jgi:hypothetical protein
MSLQQLQEKIPEVMVWIDRTLATHVHEARPIASFGFKRLGSYYSAGLLASAKAIPVARVPVPPLATMGLVGFTEFEQLNAAGITYYSSFFVNRDSAGDESLFFHELVHVVQWQNLGPARFIMAYALGHLLSGGYRTNPLEVMAYDLQARFDGTAPAFDVAAVVRPEVDRIVPALFARAAEAK